MVHAERRVCPGRKFLDVLHVREKLVQHGHSMQHFEVYTQLRVQRVRWMQDERGGGRGGEGGWMLVSGAAGTGFVYLPRHPRRA